LANIPNNPDFNPAGFNGFGKQAGTRACTTVLEALERLHAAGIARDYCREPQYFIKSDEKNARADLPVTTEDAP
jgi:hypothetical protein